VEDGFWEGDAVRGHTAYNQAISRARSDAAHRLSKRLEIVVAGSRFRFLTAGVNKEDRCKLIQVTGCLGLAVLLAGCGDTKQENRQS
jgi:hypothetical protein